MVDKKGLDSYNSTPEESKNKKHEADNEDNESTFFPWKQIAGHISEDKMFLSRRYF